MKNSIKIALTVTLISFPFFSQSAIAAYTLKQDIINFKKFQNDTKNYLFAADRLFERGEISGEDRIRAGELKIKEIEERTQEMTDKISGCIAKTLPDAYCLGE